jgi:iron(III) transport system permease protein
MNLRRGYTTIEGRLRGGTIPESASMGRSRQAITTPFWDALLTGGISILVLCFVFRNMPVGVRTGVAALAQIDKSLDEASSTLRADTLRTLRRVVLPLLKPAILTTLVFSFTHAMTAVSAVIFLATAKYNLATVYIIGRVEAGEYPLAIAYSTVLMLFMLTVLLLVQRFTGAAKLGRRERAQPLIVSGA